MPTTIGEALTLWNMVYLTEACCLKKPKIGAMLTVFGQDGVEEANSVTLALKGFNVWIAAERSIGRVLSHDCLAWCSSLGYCRILCRC